MLPHENFDGPRMQPNRKHSCGMLKKAVQQGHSR